MNEIQGLESVGARKFLAHGVGRRLSILKRSCEAIFEIFPPERDSVLNRGEVTEVQIYLHAFVMNLFGVFDSWAWAFVHFHDLAETIGRPTNVGMFRDETRRHLPPRLREYLEDPEISSWHRDYLKSYRDALAHRIPLYVPPASYSQADQLRHRQLENEKARLFGEQRWDELDAVWDEQDQIGDPCAVFLHEVEPGRRSQPVYFHPQILSDGITVVDFGNTFYGEWRNLAD